jgi:hypothetical protein
VPDGSPDRTISGLVFPPFWEVKKVGHVCVYVSPCGKSFRSKSGAFAFMQNSRPLDVAQMFDEAKTGKTGFRSFTKDERRVNTFTTFPDDWEMYKHQNSLAFVAGEVS